MKLPLKSGHQQMIESIEDYTKYYTIVKGYCDVITYQDRMPTLMPVSYTIINNDFWVILGNISEDVITDVFEDSTFKDGITREGVYEYTACIYYSTSSWEEPWESYIDYIEFNFIETFEARERNLKLEQILNKDIDFI